MSKKKRRGRVSDDDLRMALGELDDSVLEGVRGTSPEEMMERARTVLEEYDYEQAHALFKSAVWFSSGGEESVCALATFLVDDYAHFDDAVRLLRSDACEVTSTGRRLLARALFLSGQTEDALEVYEEINKRDGDAVSWRRQGKLLKEAGRLTDAVAAFSKALELAPADSEARVLREQCSEGAAKEFTEALDRARKCLDEGDVEGARASLAALNGQAWYPPAYYALQKKLEAAQASMQVSGLLSEARDAAQAGQTKAALEKYQQVLAVVPENAEAITGLADSRKLLSRQDVSRWVAMGDQRFTDGELEDALLYYFRALDRDLDASGAVPEAEPLLELARTLMQELGRVPSASQVQAVEHLFRAQQAMAIGDVGRAETFLSLASGVAGLASETESLEREIRSAKGEAAHRQAGQWYVRAKELDSQGALEEAVRLYQRAAQVSGFKDSGPAAARAAAIEKELLHSQQEASARKYLETLIEQSSFFSALTEIDKLKRQKLSLEGLEELDAAARRGVSQKYRMEVTRLEDESAQRRDRWDSSAVGFLDVPHEEARIVSTGPAGENIFVLAGNRMLSFSPTHMRPGFSASLPEQALFPSDQGAWLHDFDAEGSDVLLAVNFEERLVLYFVHRRARLELDNVFSLDKMVQQTRHKSTRWFAVYGKEQQLLICQSSPGAGSKGRIYATSLRDGRLLYDESFGYAVNNLRRFPGTDDQFIVHRYPEGVQMRRQGFFTFATMDNRMRFDRRFLIRPEDVDSTLIESTRWVRRCKTSGNMYFLFRYYDMYSGQLVNRPLAFAALDQKGELLYAASDSSTLVRNGGDLMPTGELVVSGEKEHLVLLGRKKDAQRVFVIEAGAFKLKSQFDVSHDERALSISRGAGDGAYVVTGVRKKDGAVVAREHIIDG